MVDQPELAAYEADVYTDALNQLIAKYKPEVVLAGATAVGRAFFAQVAVRARTGLTADCTALSIDKESYLLHQTRPAFGGNIMATIMTPNHRRRWRRCVRRSSGWHRPIPNAGRDADRGAQVGRRNTRIIKTERSSSSVNIAEAEIIVAGGRALKKAENLEQLKRLADLLGGVVGVSRACVDAGWISAAYQVGQTGKTVCPKLYWRSASPARSSIWRACVEPIRLLRLTPIPMPRFSMWRISGS